VAYFFVPPYIAAGHQRVLIRLRIKQLNGNYTISAIAAV